MKKLIIAACIGLGVFTVATTSAKSHVVSTANRTIVSDTDTTKTPKPDSLQLRIAE
jgi:hypothetical protein